MESFGKDARFKSFQIFKLIKNSFALKAIRFLLRQSSSKTKLRVFLEEGCFASQGEKIKRVWIQKVLRSTGTEELHKLRLVLYACLLLLFPQLGSCRTDYG